MDIFFSINSRFSQNFVRKLKKCFYQKRNEIQFYYKQMYFWAKNLSKYFLSNKNKVGTYFKFHLKNSFTIWKNEETPSVNGVVWTYLLIGALQVTVHKSSILLDQIWAVLEKSAGFRWWAPSDRRVIFFSILTLSLIIRLLTATFANDSLSQFYRWKQLNPMVGATSRFFQ
jgi:hypothetical protein